MRLIESAALFVTVEVHPVSITRFPPFRTQPLENLSVDSVKNGFLSNPAPGENLESGNLVMETECRQVALPETSATPPWKAQ